jgi:hypothetical protein
LYNKNVLEIQSKRKKRKLEKLARKQTLSLREVNVKKTKFEKCACGNPKSDFCEHIMCRACCRNKTYLENLACSGKKFYLKYL